MKKKKGGGKGRRRRSQLDYPTRSEYIQTISRALSCRMESCNGNILAIDEKWRGVHLKVDSPNRVQSISATSKLF